MPKTMRLLPNHPTMVKFNKLCDLAEDLGITMVFSGYRVIIQDKDRSVKLPELYIEDIEGGMTMDEFPPATEFKMIYEKD